MPIAVAQRNSGTGSNGTSWPITLPNTGAVDGEVYLIFVTNPSGTHTTASTGWTKVGQWNVSTTITTSAFTGVAGTAGALTVDSTVFSACAYRGIRVSGAWSGQTWATATAVTGSGTTHATASLTPALGRRKYLWVVVDGSGGFAASVAPQTAPSGWGGYGTQWDAVTSVAVTTADLVSHSASVTPGNWGNGASTSSAYVGQTLAIPEAPPRSISQLNNIPVNRATLY